MPRVPWPEENSGDVILKTVGSTRKITNILRTKQQDVLPT